MRVFLLQIAVFLALAVPVAAKSVDTGHLQAELIAQDAAAVPGSTIYVALRQKIDKGWHTYWRNPGDAGEATKVVWTLPQDWRAGDIVWARPGKLPVGPLMDFGYVGEVVLPIPIEVPASARPGTTVRLQAAAAFLVCEEICVPEDALLTLDVPIALGTSPHSRWGETVTKALADAPKAVGLDAAFTHANGVLKLAVAGAALKGADEAFFYPYSGKAILHPSPQTLERGPEGLTLTLAPGYDFTKGTPPAELSGVLALRDAAYEITATPGPAPAGTSGLGAPAGLSLPLAVVFAFLGGLILNLMPCVFPVLSMKAAALARHAHDLRAARAEAAVFTAGVMATFLALAGVLIAAKAGGAAVGWGFQLQEPAVVAALALVMLLVALNLSGLFEVGLSAQGAGSGLAAKQGLAGAFFTGALAVVVAAPCTAPFMAPALGFALTQPPAAALAVFAGLALGFAAPFALIAVWPGLLSRLPKPGRWMEVLKRALALPMYATAAWLAWVLAQQTDSAGLVRLAAAAALTAFGAWLYGRGRIVGALPVLAAFAIAIAPAYAPPAPVQTATTEVPTEPWSPERVEALRAQGRPVLVDFTAAWCVTCQVNERAALSSPAFVEALARTNAVYLKADWTNRDARIAQALAEHGRAGVPLYLLYGADGTVKVLPQLLTEGMVVKALESAVRPAAPAGR